MAAILEENTLQMAVNEIILLAFLQDGRHMTSTANQELCCIVMNINFLTFSLYYFVAVTYVQFRQKVKCSPIYKDTVNFH